MMRGGHWMCAVLRRVPGVGGRDLANWHTGAADAIRPVGGAMDLAIGGQENLCDDGAPDQIRCKQTGAGLYLPSYRHRLRQPDLYRSGRIDLSPDGARVIAMVEGMTFDELQQVTAVPLVDLR